MSNLTFQMEELAELRQAYERLKERETDAVEALRKTDEYITVDALSNAIKEMKSKIGNLEDTIKAQEVASAKKYKGYLPIVGVTIKQFKVLKVKDDKTAKVWMATNAPALLSYSDSKLLKAVENLELEWATVETEPRAQIASDLSKYLENKDEN